MIRMIDADMAAQSIHPKSYIAFNSSAEIFSKSSIL